MREEVRYYAYDETEFFDREECEAYENHICDMLTSVSEKCSFFDKDMNIFLPPKDSPDINDWLNFFDNTFNGSSIVYREENLTNEENSFMQYEFGYCFSNDDFNNETGWFRWDGYEGWVKMDE
jgi:hypothetical protein